MSPYLSKRGGKASCLFRHCVSLLSKKVKVFPKKKIVHVNRLTRFDRTDFIRLAQLATKDICLIRAAFSKTNRMYVYVEILDGLPPAM